MAALFGKGGAISALVLFASLGASPASAQMFQNNNVSCENRAVCTNGSGNCPDDSQSITCRNQSAAADFDNSGFPDCVAGVAEWNTVGQTNTSVLLNNGSGSVCGSGTGQFASAANYAEDNTSSGTNAIATILAGPLSNGSRSSALLPYAQTPSNLIFDTPNASGVFPETPSNATLFSALTTGYSASSINRTTAMFDCNADNFLDVVATGRAQVLSLLSNAEILQVLENDQAGSFSSTQVGVLVDTGNQGAASSLAVGDFNDDGISDVAVATDAKSGSVNQQILTCIGDGACGFTCGSVVDVVAVNSSTLVEIGLPTIAAGDFNGDGLDDVAVGLRNSAAGFNGVEYFYNNSSSPNTFAAPVAVSVTDETGNSFPENITTGFFNNDAIVDVAVTLSGVRGNGTAVYVITSSNDSGGLNAPLTLNFTADPATDIVDNAWSLDAADFDQQGCDDIIALGTDANGGRNAYVFMNSVETLDVDAGSSYATGAGSALQLTGTCSLNPTDSTTTASSIVPTWTIVSGPAGATLTNANTLTPTFTAASNGTYTVQLSCSSQCVPATTATATIVADLLLEGSGVFLGGCSLHPFAPYSAMGIGTMFSGLALLLGFRRRK